MAYLSLNGVDISVESARRSLVRVGGEVGARGFSGRVYGGPRRTVSEWECTTAPLTVAEATAVAGLVEGQGDAWPFNNDSYSWAGTPESARSGSVTYPFTTFTGDNPKWPQVLYITGGTGFMEWVLPAVAGAWTLIAWAMHPDYGWKHLGITSGGTRYKAGVANAWDNRIFTFTAATGVLRVQTAEFGFVPWAASTAVPLGQWHSGNGHVWLVTTAGTTGSTTPLVGGGDPSSNYLGFTTDGTAVWQNVGSSGARVGELVFLPFDVPAAWWPQLYTFHNAQPWSALPQLVAAGDFIGGGTATLVVQGEVTGSESVQFQQGASMAPGERVSFRLREV